MQIIADHISTNLVHSRKRYQGTCLSLSSFMGIIPITVGKIAAIHHRSAQCTAELLVGLRFVVRKVTAATIAKLRKIRICEAVLFNSVNRPARKFSFSLSASGFVPDSMPAILRQIRRASLPSQSRAAGAPIHTTQRKKGFCGKTKLRKREIEAAWRRTATT